MDKSLAKKYEAYTVLTKEKLLESIAPSSSSSSSSSPDDKSLVALSLGELLAYRILCQSQSSSQSSSSSSGAKPELTSSLSSITQTLESLQIDITHLVKSNAESLAVCSNIYKPLQSTSTPPTTSSSSSSSSSSSTAVFIPTTPSIKQLLNSTNTTLRTVQTPLNALRQKTTTLKNLLNINAALKTVLRLRFDGVRLEELVVSSGVLGNGRNVGIKSQDLVQLGTIVCTILSNDDENDRSGEDDDTTPSVIESTKDIKNKAESIKRKLIDIAGEGIRDILNLSSTSTSTRTSNKASSSAVLLTSLFAVIYNLESAHDKDTDLFGNFVTKLLEGVIQDYTKNVLKSIMSIDVIRNACALPSASTLPNSSDAANSKSQVARMRQRQQSNQKLALTDKIVKSLAYYLKDVIWPVFNAMHGVNGSKGMVGKVGACSEFRRVFEVSSAHPVNTVCNHLLGLMKDKVVELMKTDVNSNSSSVVKSGNSTDVEELANNSGLEIMVQIYPQFMNSCYAILSSIDLTMSMSTSMSMSATTNTNTNSSSAGGGGGGVGVGVGDDGVRAGGSGIMGGFDSDDAFFSLSSYDNKQTSNSNNNNDNNKVLSGNKKHQQSTRNSPVSSSSSSLPIHVQFSTTVFDDTMLSRGFHDHHFMNTILPLVDLMFPTAVSASSVHSHSHSHHPSDSNSSNSNSNESQTLFTPPPPLPSLHDIQTLSTALSQILQLSSPRETSGSQNLSKGITEHIINECIKLISDRCMTSIMIKAPTNKPDASSSTKNKSAYFTYPTSPSLSSSELTITVAPTLTCTHNAQLVILLLNLQTTVYNLGYNIYIAPYKPAVTRGDYETTKGYEEGVDFKSVYEMIAIKAILKEGIVKSLMECEDGGVVSRGVDCFINGSEGGEGEGDFFLETLRNGTLRDLFPAASSKPSSSSSSSSAAASAINKSSVTLDPLTFLSTTLLMTSIRRYITQKSLMLADSLSFEKSRSSDMLMKNIGEISVFEGACRTFHDPPSFSSHNTNNNSGDTRELSEAYNELVAFKSLLLYTPFKAKKDETVRDTIVQLKRQSFYRNLRISTIAGWLLYYADLEDLDDSADKDKIRISSTYHVLECTIPYATYTFTKIEANGEMEACKVYLECCKLWRKKVQGLEEKVKGGRVGRVVDVVEVLCGDVI